MQKYVRRPCRKWRSSSPTHQTSRSATNMACLDSRNAAGLPSPHTRVGYSSPLSRKHPLNLDRTRKVITYKPKYVADPVTRDQTDRESQEMWHNTLPRNYNMGGPWLIARPTICSRPLWLRNSVRELKCSCPLIQPSSDVQNSLHFKSFGYLAF